MKGGGKYPAFLFVIISYLIMKNNYKILFTLLSLLGLLFVFSCKEDEQNRILNYQKGVYLGKEDEKLDKTILDSLSQHVNRQSYN